MAKVAVILHEWFEDSEYTSPAKALNEAEHDTTTVGLKPGETVKGKRENTLVRVEKDVRSENPQGYDALLIPGGYSPDQLRAFPEPVAFVRHFMEAGKPVFTICHGAQLLVTADALKGRRTTGWKSIIRDIENAGAEYVDEEVVVDGNLVASRSPADLPAFNAACIRMLSQND
jgi:protease I